MENNPIKRGRGRPKKYNTAEEKKYHKNEQTKASMNNRKWTCIECDKQMHPASKYKHLASLKHQLKTSSLKHQSNVN